MTPLRLITLNAQLLPLIENVVSGTSSLPDSIIGLFPGTVEDAKERATVVASGLLNLPTARRPHVIVLNEVFSEDGRAVLIEKLKGVWPNYIDRFAQLDLEEDAGLMIFSQHSFIKLDNGLFYRCKFFENDAGDDSWASKAAALVQIATPRDPTTIVFTHLQASYIGEDEHRAVREKQFDEILELIGYQLGQRSAWRHLIVLGDLNVRGDPGSTSDEYATIFELKARPFGEVFKDAWVDMAPLGDVSRMDEGQTNRNRATGEKQRLDFQCIVRQAHDLPLVPHHMRVTLRNVSDHFALEGLYQVDDHHAQPARAVDADTAPAAAGSTVPYATSVIKKVDVQINQESDRFWIFLPRPGTYSFHKAAAIDYDVYAHDNISDPLARLDGLSVAELPPGVKEAYERIEGLDPKGETFVCRKPMLLSLRADKAVTHQSIFTVLEHRGDSRATAISLPPFMYVQAPFPTGQRLGAKDLCWFRFDPVTTLVGSARNEKVSMKNTTSTGAQLAVLDTSEAVILDDASGNPTVELAVTTSGGETLLLNVRRADDSKSGHAVRWDTSVCYLRLDKPLGIHVDDETGPDAFGADEPELLIYMDSDPAPLVSTTWDDADTGEEWPKLVNIFKTACVSRGVSSDSVPFSRSLSAEIVEPDDPLGMAHGVPFWDVNALPPSKTEMEVRRTMEVFDTVSDGTYTFFCTVTRDP